MALYTRGDTSMAVAIATAMCATFADSNTHNIVRYCLLSAWKVLVLMFVMNVAVYRTFMRRW